MYLFKFHKSVSFLGCNCTLREQLLLRFLGSSTTNALKVAQRGLRRFRAACWGKG